jgi:hypothetical protein
MLFASAVCYALWDAIQWSSQTRGLMTAAAFRQRDFRTAHGVYFREMDHGTDVCSRPLVPYPTPRTHQCVTSTEH